MSSRIRSGDRDPGGSAVVEERREAAPSEPREPPPQPEPAPQEPEPQEPERREPEEREEQPPAGALEEGSEADRTAQQRIRRLTREKYEAEQRAAQAEQRWRESQRPQAPPPGSMNEAEQRAYQRFQAEQGEWAFAQRCNGLWDRAVGEYGTGEMNEAKAALDAVGWGNTPDALFTLTELPDGHRIYRELASDLDNAARILKLPHDQRTIALTRMSQGNGAAPATTQAETLRNLPPVSRAPEPHRPVGGTSARREPALDDPKMSMAEFIRRRDREERGSRIRR